MIPQLQITVPYPSHSPASRKLGKTDIEEGTINRWTQHDKSNWLLYKEKYSPIYYNSDSDNRSGERWNSAEAWGRVMWDPKVILCLSQLCSRPNRRDYPQELLPLTCFLDHHSNITSSILPKHGDSRICQLKMENLQLKEKSRGRIMWYSKACLYLFQPWRWPRKMYRPQEFLSL